MMTCQKFFDIYPHPYFWTFTFVSVMPDWYYSQCWANFIRDLQNVYGQMILGVKVLEVHPGGHGLHYHAILNKRISVHFVRRIGKKYGVGIVQVKKCDIGAANYLVPYLKKEDGLSKGIRRWGTVGGFVGVKFKDVEVDTPFQRNMTHITKGKKVSFPLACQIYRSSQVWSDLSAWPESELSKLGKWASELRSVTPSRVYNLDMSRRKTYLNIQKPIKPDLTDSEIYRVDWNKPVKFGCMVWIQGKWIHESRVVICDSDYVPFDILAARVDQYGENWTESQEQPV